MIEWKKAEELAVFDFNETYVAKHGVHYITVSKLSDWLYEIQYFRGAILTIKHSYFAKSWFEARALAISAIKEHMENQSHYWRELKGNFSRWCDE